MNKKKIYSNWFLVPALAVFICFFMIPMVLSLFFSLTVWNFNGFKFTGIDNFIMFFKESSLRIGIKNSLLYAVLTSSLKVILSFFIALFLTSGIKTKIIQRSIVFFPNLVSTVAVGITFTALMHPSKGLFNKVLEMIGINGINWLGDKNLALFSVVGADVWKGLSIATVIFIAGIQSIDKTYYEAATVDGANYWQRLINITIPLSRASMNSIILLSFIGGLRSFDLIWSMTGGGPGFATDVMASIIYKQYAAGYYGLSTAGNVIMFVIIAVIIFPLQRFLLSKEAD